MAVTHGARTEVLGQIGESFGREAHTIEQVHLHATRAVTALSEVWRGPDASRYAARWAAQERALLEASQRLFDMAEQLGVQADQQTQTSGAAGFGPSRPGGPPGPGGPQNPGPPPVPPAPPTDPLAPVPGTIDEQIRGTDPQRIDKDIWKLAWHSYGPDNGSYGITGTEQPPLPEGWSQVSDAELAMLGITRDELSMEGERGDGFSANLYKNEQGQYVLAFRGSDGQSQDWLDQNFTQALGFGDEPPSQYRHAMELGMRLDAATNGNVVFTGHSLGGGLADAAGLATGNAAITFDGAGIHEKTAEYAAGLNGDHEGTMAAFHNQDAGQFRNYSTESDILTNAQALTPLPDTLGTTITLPIVNHGEQAVWTATGTVAGALGGTIATTAGGAVVGHWLGTQAEEALGMSNGLLSSAGAALGGSLGFSLGLNPFANVIGGGLVGSGAHGHSWKAVDAGIEARIPG